MVKILFIITFILLIILAPVVNADYVQTLIQAGIEPQDIVLNPVTHKIYVVNRLSSDVTVIDGLTGDKFNVETGQNPVAAAINPISNKIYIANYGTPENPGSTITVIDGSSQDTTTVSTGIGPKALAVNPVTNKIYVANYGTDNSPGNTVTIIDGSDTTNVSCGVGPMAVAVNPVTNKIYVANYGHANNPDSTITVIDGVDDSTTTVNCGVGPAAVAVNPVTNKIYVANYGTDNYPGNTVTVIDGSNLDTTSVICGAGPAAIAINPVTDKIYVANYGTENSPGNSVTVINGSNLDTTTVSCDLGPRVIAVNTQTNKIYVGNQESDGMTIINGFDNSSSDIEIEIESQIVAIAIDPNSNIIYAVGLAYVFVIAGETYNQTSLSTGNEPTAVAINPVTNYIYVANSGLSGLTVVDGEDSLFTIDTGTSPRAVAVNPLSNKIYVANSSSINNDITIIDGQDHSSIDIDNGDGAYAIAINPVTCRVYVANVESNDVTVLDGENNVMATVAVGQNPRGIAINSLTNKIYVTNSETDSDSGSVTIIDGIDHLTETITTGPGPRAIAVNSSANKIYVANYGSINSPGNMVTVIDGGDDHSITTVPTGSLPRDIDINQISNKIYVANYLSNNVSVIDGTDHSVIPFSAGDGPWAVTVDQAANKIYVTNKNSNDLTIIDGRDHNIRHTIECGGQPEMAAVNPFTNKIYITNPSNSSLTIIDPVQSAISPQPAINPLITSIDTLPADTTISNRPIFNFEAVSNFEPVSPPIQQIYFQTDTRAGNWRPASTSGDTGSGITNPLDFGSHFCFAFAIDAQAASINSGAGYSPFVGQISAYYFTVLYSPVNISSLVWLDWNANGSQDDGEPGFSGVTVELYEKAEDNLLEALISDSQGNCAFSGYETGKYYLRFIQPNGYGFSLPDQAQDQQDSDVDPTTGIIDSLRLLSGDYVDYAAGLIDTPYVLCAIPDLFLAEDSSDTLSLTDLNEVFFDLADSSQLTFQVDQTNPGALFTAIIDSADSSLGLIDFRLDANGSDTIFVQAIDRGGLFAEDTLLVTIEPVNDQPIINNVENLEYTPGNPPRTISRAIMLSDVDDSIMTNATVALDSGFNPDEDVLSAVGVFGITPVYDSDNGLLSLSPAVDDSMTTFECQTALQTVSYYNSNRLNPDLGPRQVIFTIDDGSGAVMDTCEITFLSALTLIEIMADSIIIIDGQTIFDLEQTFPQEG
ncbi:MAG: beta-propeller fold lactonase family protein, partial [Planctomycetes bacterium]|nr:beta-propeller fold lactonase family protein [Planctomycetota bacterium]